MVVHRRRIEVSAVWAINLDLDNLVTVQHLAVLISICNKNGSLLNILCFIGNSFKLWFPKIITKTELL